MKNHRILGSVITGLDKGENLFIFHGKYIHDWFLYGLYHGVMKFRDTLERFYLVEKGFDYFIYCRNNVFEVLKSSSKGEIIITNELVRGRVDDSDPLNGLNSSSQKSDSGTDNLQQAREAAENIAEPDKAAFLKAVEYCKNNPKSKVAFFFEDFEWTAGLHKSSNDAELFYIAKALELADYNNCVVNISIANAEMLSKYNIDINKKSVNMIGSATVDEIWHSFARIYFRNRKSRKKVSENDFSELSLIAEAVGADDKSLKEVIRIFNRVMNENNWVVDKYHFETALDKHIEEKVSLDDVVMSDEVKTEIVARIDEFLKTDDQSNITKGIILAGPPGTGKTFIVKALANEKNCYFMSPSLADLKGEFVGQTSAKVKRIFQQARGNAPTIIFIDEADTVFPVRDTSADSDSFAKDMVNQFLVEMDGLGNGNSKVFVIAATNRVNIVDNAIKSRLGTTINVSLPDKRERRQLFANHLRKENAEKLCKLPFFDEFLDKTNRMSGRDIKNFVMSLKTEASSKTRNLSDYNSNDEVKQLFYSALSQYEQNLINDLQNKLNISIEGPKPDLNYKSIIGCENVKNAVNRQLRTFDAAGRKHINDYNIKPKRGILLYGPPGNGKTQMARAAASENNLLFIKVTSDTFAKKTLSEQSQTLLDVFSGAIQLSELCSKQRGVLLFFDEFDSLASENLLDSRIRGTLLTQLDDKETMRNPATKVLFMAATNFYQQIDEAVIRSGRIDEKILMDNPTPSQAKELIVKFCRRNPMVEELSENLVNEMYSEYIKSLKEKWISERYNQYKKQWLYQGRSINELTENLKVEAQDEVKPSIASIESFVERLIENAYDERSINEQSKKLFIDSAVIKITCDRLDGTER